MKKNRNSEMKIWRDSCERQLKRSLQERLDYGFVYSYKPVLDDAETRVFDSIIQYREWCHSNLPVYLGYRINEKAKSI